MTFCYTEPQAGNIWVFSLDGSKPTPVALGTNLITIEGGLPRVGERGHTLGGCCPDTDSSRPRVVSRSLPPLHSNRHPATVGLKLE